jgi:hypothetical protein
MCWSGEASTVLATAGFAGTAWAAYRKEPMSLWMALGYFSLMEALQAYTYSVINQCENPTNQIATLLGYLHITFQPFFANAVALHFIPAAARKRFAPVAYSLCFVSALVMLIQLYPFEWAGLCDPLRPLCGKMLCSVRGNWHIAWLVPTNGIGNSFVHMGIAPLADGFPTYVLAVFLLPLFYGSWRVVLYHALMGPWLAARLTNNINEWPAVWCLLSIGLLLIVVKTPVRRALYVKRSWKWKRELPASV